MNKKQEMIELIKERRRLLVKEAEEASARAEFDYSDESVNPKLKRVLNQIDAIDELLVTTMNAR